MKSLADDIHEVVVGLLDSGLSRSAICLVGGLFGSAIADTIWTSRVYRANADNIRHEIPFLHFYSQMYINLGTELFVWMAGAVIADHKTIQIVELHVALLRFYQSSERRCVFDTCIALLEIFNRDNRDAWLGLS